jgi:hypothetical protein
MPARCTYHRDRDMIEVVIHRPMTMEVGTRFPVNPHGICGGLSYSGIGFSLLNCFVPVSSSTVNDI